MPSFNNQGFKRIRSKYQELCRSYENVILRLSGDIPESYDIVSVETDIYELNGIIKELIKLKGDTEGLFNIVQLNTKEIHKDYEDMLKKINDFISNGIEVLNNNIDKFNSVYNKSGLSHLKIYL